MGQDCPPSSVSPISVIFARPSAPIAMPSASAISLMRRIALGAATIMRKIRKFSRKIPGPPREQLETMPPTRRKPMRQFRAGSIFGAPSEPLFFGNGMQRAPAPSPFLNRSDACADLLLRGHALKALSATWTCHGKGVRIGPIQATDDSAPTSVRREPLAFNCQIRQPLKNATQHELSASRLQGESSLLAIVCLSPAPPAVRLGADPSSKRR
jgi:hypothetical protein